MKIQHFFDKDTFTLTYVVYNEDSNEAVVIDPVWNYDPASGKLTEESIEELLTFFKTHKLKPVLNIDTHAHADHLTGSQVLKKHFPDMKVAISERIRPVQDLFAGVFNIRDELKVDGSQFDLLVRDYEKLNFAGLQILAIPTPGHTPACTSYLIEDALFTGDTIFMPDSGTGRSDFPAGSTKTLFHSIKENLYSLPDATRVFVGHDYQPNGRPLEFQTTIGELKKKNFQINESTKEEDFVSYQDQRDKALAAPRLLLPSIQVNIRAGHLPKAETNNVQYLKIPLKTVSKT